MDPVNFPPEYLGTDGDGKMPGMGYLEAFQATVANAPLGYYMFPHYSDLSLAVDGQLIIPLAYNFDEGGTTKCTPPEDYVYDQQRDDVRYDQQGNIFTLLPDDPYYIPVVADVAVRSNGLPCQDTKSELNVVDRTDVSLDLVPVLNPDETGPKNVGKPSGKYYARVIIDPSVDVRNPDGSVDPNTFLGPQKWGWYQRYLLAYLDGGEVPTLDKQVPNGTGQAQRVTEMVTQAIFYPSQHPGTDDLGNTVPVPGALGEGYDVISVRRGDAGYSPLCQVFTFDPLDPMAPEGDVKDIDMSTAQPTGEYVWCIQVAQ